MVMLLMFLLFRDSSIAPLLDMRRRFKAVMDVLDAMIRHGISLSRSVELSAQWDRILAIRPLYPVTLDDLSMVQGVGLGDFYRAVCVMFIVVLVIFEPLGVGGIGFGRILLFIRKGGFVLIFFPLLLFSSVSPIFRLVVLECSLILLRLMRNSERPGFPIFVALGKGRPALRNSMWRLRDGCLSCLKFLCLV